MLLSSSTGFGQDSVASRIPTRDRSSRKPSVDLTERLQSKTQARKRNAWRHLLLLYMKTDASYEKEAKTGRVTGDISTSLASTVEEAFRTLPVLVETGSGGAVAASVQVIRVSRPVSHVSQIRDHYWLSPTDVQQELEQFAPAGAFDAVHVVWASGPLLVFFGLGGAFVNDGKTTFSSIVAGDESWWKGANPGEVFLHEWLHGACRYFQGLGYVMPDLDADGGSMHGYQESANDGWMTYLGDLMRGNVWEGRLSRYTGITAEAWKRGRPGDP